jgi:hypothetical protein
VGPKSERNQPAVRRGKRIAQVIYLVIATGFIVDATWQVERQVFGAPRRSRATDPNCSYAVVAFEEALTRGLAHAAEERSRGKAEQTFEDIVSTPLAAVEKRCGGGPDEGAYVAASRLRDAAEASVDSQQVALGPLRAAVEARRNP